MTEEVKKTEEVVAEVAEETTKKQKKSSRRQILKGRATLMYIQQHDYFPDRY